MAFPEALKRIVSIRILGTVYAAFCIVPVIVQCCQGAGYAGFTLETAFLGYLSSASIPVASVPSSIIPGVFGCDEQ